MSTSLLEITVDKAYHLITFNSPETLNAFSQEMIKELITSLESLSEEPNPKPLILTGKGKAFSSGGNLALMKEYADRDQGPDYIKSIVPYVNRVITLLMEYPGPTMAILNGSAVGGGFNIAMACDFRIVNERAKFRLGFIDIGLTPATGNSFFVTKTLGIAKTLSLSLLSQVFTAKQMLDWGLCNQIYTSDTFEEIKSNWKSKLFSLDPWQVKSVRKLLYSSLTNSYDQQLQQELETLLEASSRDLFKNRVNERLQQIQSKH